MPDSNLCRPLRSKPLLLAAALLASCGRAEVPPETEASRINVLYYYNDLTLGPDSDAKFLAFLPLVGWKQGEEVLEGLLARSWEHSDDYRTWTFHLRSDMKWHDGVPVTAHDIAFTLELLQDSAVAVLPSGSVSAEVLDDSTVRVVYHGRTAQIPDTWTTFLPRHLLEHEDPKRFASWEFWKRPVGNGPYRVVRFVPNEVIDYEANPDYPLRPLRIKNVRFKIAQSPVTELVSGNVDAAYVERNDLLALERDPRFRVYWSTPYNPKAIYWERRRFPAFGDVRVRRALTMALDRRELHRVLNLPPETPLVDGVFAERQLRRKDLPPAVPFDPAGARRLLAEAGWENRDGDGILERDGVPFRFTLGVRPEDERTAVVVQAQLRRVGVEVEILAVERGALQVKARSGEVHAVVGFTGNLNPEMFRADSPLYENPRLAELVERRRWTADPDERRRLDDAITEVLRADLPMTYLHPLFGTMVAHRRVRGLQSPHITDPVIQMEHLWLEEPSR